MKVSIFSCKMYKTANNKQRILASIQDPINAELVEQLKEYIDIPSADTSEDSAKVVLQDIKVQDESESRDSENTKESNSTTENVGESDKNTEKPEITENDSEQSSTDEESDKPVEESTKVAGTKVIAQTVLYEPNRCVAYTSIDDVVHELKGALNLKDDTAGVSRVQVKQNELWIYYNDSVNLNSVMNPVLDYLNSASYNYLEFNRLARSDNAIVFEISFIDTANVMKPEGAMNVK